MSKTKRDDVHSEAHLAPEDYRYYGAYDSRPDYPMGDGALEYKRVLIAELIARNGSIHGLGQCAHCGHHLRHIVIFEHAPTGDLVSIGQDCAFTRMGLSDALFKDYMRGVNAARKLAKAEGAGAAWRKANPMIVEFFKGQEWKDWKFYCKAFLNSLHGSLARHGSLTDNQTAAAIKAITYGRVHEAKAAQRDADRDVERANAIDCPEGRMVIEGEIIKVDFQVNGYGTREVMTVKADAGWLVWGTMPRSLYGAEKGERIRFTGTITRSHRDAKFGFAKRPSKAMIIDAEGNEVDHPEDQDTYLGRAGFKGYQGSENYQAACA
jgi:hypothetical protein